jgi:hypothetical protein
MAGGVFLSAQRIAIPEPRRGAGDSITAAYEGWYYNPDGSRAFLIGYYNRNARQEMDIPIGPNNHMDPGGPDMGQPTHFLTGRQWGMFSVQAPKEFKPTDSYSWTIVANGQSVTIPFRLHPDYVMAPFSEIAVGNTPPVIKFEQNGKTIQGPIGALTSAPTRTATVGQPLQLPLWGTDDMKYTSGTNAPLTRERPPITVRWSKYRGPGDVKFDKPRPEFEKLSQGEGMYSGRATANATFSEPGEYVLHVTANDYSGDGGQGFGCCWTTALLKVSVK